MTTSGLSISRLVNFSAIVTPAGVQALSTSSGLVLDDGAIIDVVTRMRTYQSDAEVAADWGTSSPPYLAAVAWFGQTPQPKTMSVGRWAKTASAGQLYCGALTAAQQALADWTAITAGAFTIYEDGVPHKISGLDFHLQTTLSGVAAVIQTALAAAEASSEVVWNSTYGRFELTSGTTGPSSTMTFLSPPTAMGYFDFGVTNPSPGDTLHLDGTLVTFGDGTGGTAKVAGSLPATLANLLTFLDASVAGNIPLMSYAVDTSKLYCVSKLVGTAGDAYTLAASAATPSGATLTTGAGADISGQMAGLSTSSGAYVANGIAAETALAAVVILDEMYGGLWYHLFGPEFADADAEAIAPYLDGDATPHFLWYNSQESGMLLPGATTDIGYLLQQLMSQHAFVQYSSTSTVAAWSAAARISTVNWAGSNTAISLMYKQEPGIPPDVLTDSQITALEGYNVNVFVEYDSGAAILEPGICPSGQFADTIIGVDWLRSQCQVNVFNILTAQPAKVPQTDAGVNTLLTGVNAACAQGVTNGLGAPGVWNTGGFGSLQEGQTLPKGYYTYAPPIATQSEADRADRVCPPIQVAFKLAGAIDLVSGTIFVNA